MKRMLFIICTLFLFIGHVFSQLERPNSLIHGVCWAKRNVDKPGTFVATREEYGMLYQWEASRGWIATNFVTGGDTIISAKDPCPAGWRMPTVEETKSLRVGDIGGSASLGSGYDEGSFVNFHSTLGNSNVFFPIYFFPEENSIGTPKSGYWSGSEDTNDSSKAWAFFFKKRDRGVPPADQQLVSRNCPLLVRCVKEKCDTIVTDTFETILAEDLPYKWGDTVFDIGTVSGIYRFHQGTCAYNRTTILHLTVQQEGEKPCPGVLINDVCWAEYNVDEPGTFAVTPEASGMLYQWNRRKGWSATESVSGWDSSLPSGSCWDAANDPCPTGWRVPIREEFDALLDNTNVTCIVTSQNGVGGRKFTDNATGSSIFLPGVNYREDNNAISHPGSHGWYWSSSSSSSMFASSLFFTALKIAPLNWLKNFGIAIRCVVGDPPDCGSIVTDTSLTVCTNDLPYEWGDTIFDVGTESGVYRFQYISTVTGNDSLVNLHLTIQQPFDTTFYDTVCRGASYNRYGFSLSDVQTDGDYTLSLSSQAGCDSVLTLHLKVHPVYGTTLYDTICQGNFYSNYGFSLPSGTSGGTFTKTYSTVHGCDSTVILNLHVHPVYLFSATQNICQGDTFDFRGRKLYKSGVYYDSLTTVHGCDSIYRLKLTVHPSPRQNFSGVVCSGSSYNDHGFNLSAVTVDTIVRDTFKTRWGCDSIRTLYLTVHPVYDTTLYDTICQGNSYSNYGFSLPSGTSGGTFTKTYSTIHGCDSIVTLNLHVHPVYLFSETQHICQGDSISFRGRWLHTSGVYYDSLTTVHGCDSIYRLTLSVHSTSPLLFPDKVCYGSGYNKYGFSLPSVYHDTLVRDTFRSVWGCDSIRILSLSVQPVYDTPLYDTVCQGDGYYRHGFTLPSVQVDGVHTLTLSSRSGCDSTLILHLKVHPVYNTVLYDSICPSDYYERYGFRLSNLHESSTYRRTESTVHGCDSTVTLHLHVWPTYFYPETVHLCEGDTFDFRGMRYHESGEYYDTLTTTKGCDSIYCLYLSVHPVYDIQLCGVLCEGIPYTQGGFHVSTPGLHYQYLQSAFGCDSTVTLTLTEEKKIEGSIRVLLEDCSTHGYSFFFDPGDMINHWEWDLGDGTLLRSEECYHQYSDSGTYRIQLHAETYNECENRFSYVQRVPPYLREVVIHSDRQVIDEDYPTVHFRTEVFPGMRCLWDFGDGERGEGDRVSHTYNARTEKYYEVRLQVLNSDSCVTESRMDIEVVFLPKVLNTFSPNGDGINDVFMPDYVIEIIDRNGLRIYSGDSGWDGTYNGRQAKEDTYFYRLHYRTANGKRQKTGYVTLIR